MAGGKPLETTLEISGVLSPSLQKTVQGAIDRFNEMSKETLASAGAAEKLAAEISAQETVLKSLRKGYADFVVSGKESSEEAQTLKKKIQELSGELDENRDTFKAAENAANNLSDSVEDAGEKAEESSGGYTVLKNVLANLITEGIGAAVEGFKELAFEGDTALGKLAAKTGVTGEKMADFEDVLYDVYNSNYGESLGDVSEALSTVINMTDNLDNASLAKITKNAIALEDVFGFDTTESMRAVNSLMDQFGLTADQAFNLIVQGAQKGLDQNGDLLDTINEYSVQFRTAGYSADDMFNMLANGTETGTWSVDKLGDAVKEFNIRMSDGSAADYLEQLGLDVKGVTKQFNKGGPEAQKAIGTVMKALQECDNAIVQYQAGVGLFGTMWEDLGADTVASLMQTEGGIKSTANAMEQMDGAAYDTLESSLRQLGRTVKAEVLQPIGESLTPMLKDLTEFLTNNVGPAVTWIKDNLSTLGFAFGGVTAAIVAFKVAAFSAKLATQGLTIATYAQQVAQGLLNAVMNANPIGLIILGITALITVFKLLWDNCEGFRQFFLDMWENIKNAVSIATEWISNAFDSSLAWIKNTWGTVSEWFSTSVVEPVKNFFSGMWDGLVNGAKSAWEGIKNTFSAVANFFKNIFSTAWAGVKAVFSTGGKIFDGIKDGIVTAFKTVVNAIIKGINKVITAPFKGLNRVLDTISGLSIAGVEPFSWLTWRAPVPEIPLLAAGGFTNGVSIAGEAGTEAVISFDPAYRDKNVGIWEQAGRMLGVLRDEEQSAGLSGKAGELLKLDDFSLGSLANNTTIIIYYDFSNFTWSPQVNADGSDGDDVMAKLKAHEAEFFEWLEEFIQMREEAAYA